jgi:hypothetical protein
MPSSFSHCLYLSCWLAAVGEMDLAACAADLQTAVDLEKSVVVP